MSKHPMGTDSARAVEAALEHLREARVLLRSAGALKAAERVRLAITSTGGALRHARLAPYRAERRARTGGPK